MVGNVGIRLAQTLVCVIGRRDNSLSIQCLSDLRRACTLGTHFIHHTDVGSVRFIDYGQSVLRITNEIAERRDRSVILALLCIGHHDRTNFL